MRRARAGRRPENPTFFFPGGPRAAGRGRTLISSEADTSRLAGPRSPCATCGAAPHRAPVGAPSRQCAPAGPTGPDPGLNRHSPGPLRTRGSRPVVGDSRQRRDNARALPSARLGRARIGRLHRAARPRPKEGVGRARPGRPTAREWARRRISGPRGGSSGS